MSANAPDRSPRLLVIDDNAAIHEDFKKILGGRSTAGSRLGDAEKALFGGSNDSVERVAFRIDSAYQGKVALKMVQQAIAENDPYALAFVDVRMPPGWDGVETLEHIWKTSPNLQAVICTAYSDYSWDDLIRRFGQKDNLLILKKPFETVEVLQVAHALAKKWDLSFQAQLKMEDLDQMVRERTEKLQKEVEERARVQEALRISEERFSKAFQASPMPMAIQSLPDRRFLDANSSFLSLVGYAREQLVGCTDQELCLWEKSPGDKHDPAESDDRVRNRPSVLRHANGSCRNTLLWTEPLVIDSLPCLLVLVEDVSNRMKLEAQLRQSQKMEIVGRMTASVAHEFNNLLTVIQGHASLLKDGHLTGRNTGDSIERIVQATQRAASFTGQLLAFSRKQPLQQLKAVNVSETIRSMKKMLAQLVGERFELQLDCPSNVPFVRVSDGSIEQVLVNLALNARDAMPDGGKIWVGTSLEVLDESGASRHPEACAGRFVCLTVMDSGCGMNADVLAHIFDPFYTTKEVGKGTGLGLSAVHGIVHQHQGWVQVVSQLGHGSTFTIFIPVWEEAPARAKLDAPKSLAESQRGSGETILVVEDDAGVRELARVTLEQGGYDIVEAGDGREALEVWENNRGAIDMLVTDVVMPNGLSGGSLATTLQERNPRLRVICTSGYNPEFIKKDLPTTRGIIFLPKPYSPQMLLEAVKKGLEGGTPAVTQGAGRKPELAST
jgi:two-component system, cell cycle sensor histidine kinase and response regulator CckA